MKFDMVKTENGFRDEFFFLSNFYEAPVMIMFEGEKFILPTGEHVFQGMKVVAALTPEDNVEKLRLLEKAPTPGKAKYWGRSIRIDVPKWDSLALKCMRRSLELKFSQHPDLRDKLINTGDVELIEFNDWNDTLWGVNQKTGVGKNQLGKLLMELRTEYNNS